MWKYQNTDELYHYGILGMKWGVRRYHNKDGTLNSQGRARKAQKILDKINDYNDDWVNKEKAILNGVRGKKIPNKKEKDKKKKIRKTIGTIGGISLGTVFAGFGAEAIKTSLIMGQPVSAVLGGAMATASALSSFYGTYISNNSNKILKKKIAKGKKELEKLGYKLDKQPIIFDYEYDGTRYNPVKASTYKLKKK